MEVGIWATRQPAVVSTLFTTSALATAHSFLSLTCLNLSGDFNISHDKLQTVDETVQGKIQETKHHTSVDEGTVNGWTGGTVWLVPTDQPLDEWKPIATREL